MTRRFFQGIRGIINFATAYSIRRKVSALSKSVKEPKPDWIRIKLTTGAEATENMNLRHCVVTSVARDDLKDGGATIFAETIKAIRARTPLCSVEVLIPDFLGDADSLQIVMDAKPDILNHNIETVERMSDRVRAKAKYRRSLELLQRAKSMQPEIPTKSSIMLGVGEE